MEAVSEKAGKDAEEGVKGSGEEVNAGHGEALDGVRWIRCP